MRLFLGTMILTLWTASINTFAEEPLAPPSAIQKPAKKKPSKAKENLKMTADTDGTAAPNRFEAETAIKSEYTLDGKPLEVDPD